MARHKRTWETIKQFGRPGNVDYELSCIGFSPALVTASSSNFVMSPLKRDIFLFSSSLTLHRGLHDEPPKKKHTDSTVNMYLHKTTLI